MTTDPFTVDTALWHPADRRGVARHLDRAAREQPPRIAAALTAIATAARDTTRPLTADLTALEATDRNDLATALNDTLMAARHHGDPVRDALIQVVADYMHWLRHTR